MKLKIVLACILFICSGSVFSQLSHMTMEHSKCMDLLPMDFKDCKAFQQLSLDKKAQVERMIANYKELVRVAKKDLTAKWELLDAQFRQPKINEEEVHTLVADISELHKHILSESVQATIGITKATGFIPVQCWGPKTSESSGLQMRKEGMMQSQPHQGLQVGAKNGFQNSPREGLESSSTQGMTDKNQD